MKDKKPRPSVSTLGQAILGLLARRPSTGYELAQRLDRPVGYFWTARHSQIYPELARLTDAGLVRYAESRGRGPRSNKRYRISAAGLRALRAWVVSVPEPQAVRDLETLRLWSLWTVAPDQATAVVDHARATHAATLAAYEDELAELADDPDAREPSHPLFASRLTLEGGVRTRRAAVEWCDWMLQELTIAEAKPTR
jgi:DNA-binding PadR family transcriptional regulator